MQLLYTSKIADLIIGLFLTLMTPMNSTSQLYATGKGAKAGMKLPLQRQYSAVDPEAAISPSAPPSPQKRSENTNKRKGNRKN